MFTGVWKVIHISDVKNTSVSLVVMDRQAITWKLHTPHTLTFNIIFISTFKCVVYVHITPFVSWCVEAATLTVIATFVAAVSLKYVFRIVVSSRNPAQLLIKVHFRIVVSTTSVEQRSMRPSPHLLIRQVRKGLIVNTVIVKIRNTSFVRLMEIFNRLFTIKGSKGKSTQMDTNSNRPVAYTC